MSYLRLALATALLAVLVLTLAPRVSADEPPDFTFDKPVPGAVEQNEKLYLAGDGMHSQWRAILSRVKVGTDGKTDFYQWYLSIYAIDDTTYKLKYRSPGNGGPFSTVTKAHGAQLWFPMQSAKIDAPISLMMQGKDNLVVESHEAGADCGAATIAVFTTNAAGNVVPAVSVRNGCSLTAQPVNAAAGAKLLLSGPYYAADAAMCCPTKPNATATLQYLNGTWVETPRYYELFPGKLPPQ
jgi:hypothetical protein